MSVQVFVEPGELIAGELSLKGDEHHYISKVRRLRVDDRVQLFDGEGHKASARILSIGAKHSVLSVETPESVAPPAFSLHVACAIIKGERMDFAIEKLVELGVTDIHPMHCERSVVRIKADKAEARRRRYEATARAASRQSQNPHPARIHPIRPLAEVIDETRAMPLRLFPHPEEAVSLAKAIDEENASAAIVFIGPEGGFSPAEVKDARDAGCTPVALGERILRAESACIAMAAILGFRYGTVGSR